MTVMKETVDDPRVKGMIGGSKVSLIFLIALVVFGYHIQFSIILALVAGTSYGLLVAWWHGQEEPPSQPLLKTFEQALSRKKGRTNIVFARDERKRQAQIKAERIKEERAKAERARQPQQSAPDPDDSQNAQGNYGDPDQS